MAMSSVNVGEEEKIGELLWQVASIWRKQMEEVLKPHRLTHTQYIILEGIWHFTRHGKTVTQKALAAFTRSDLTMTSQVLRTLEKRQLIQRKVNVKDERARYPMLTVAGIELLNKAMPEVIARDREIFQILGTEQQAFCQALHKLKGI